MVFLFTDEDILITATQGQCAFVSHQTQIPTAWIMGLRVVHKHKNDSCYAETWWVPGTKKEKLGEIKNKNQRGVQKRNTKMLDKGFWGRTKMLAKWSRESARSLDYQHCFPESLHPYWNWRWRRRRHWISAFFFIAACLWFLLPNFPNQFFFLPSGMVTSLSHVLLEKLLSSLLDPKFPLQSVARNSPLAQFLGHPVLPRFQPLLSLTSTNKAKLGQGLRRNPWKSIRLWSYPTCNICCCCCWRFSGGIRFSVACCCSRHDPCTPILEAWEELFWLCHEETLGALCNQLYDSSFCSA